MHASEIIRPVAQHSSWLLNLGPHDYLKPAWGLVRTRDRGTGLFVWCDECLSWNCHGLCDDEHDAGKVTSRGPHCQCHDEGMIYCMGMIGGELAKNAATLSVIANKARAACRAQGVSGGGGGERSMTNMENIEQVDSLAVYRQQVAAEKELKPGMSEKAKAKLREQNEHDRAEKAARTKFAEWFVG